MEQYYYIVTYIMAGILGLCVGSFLNVVIYRVPLKMNIAKPPSHCPNCNYVLKWYDNIPLLSYTILRGKCRGCGQHISFRYTAVELANTLLWLACVWRFYGAGLHIVCMAATVCSVLICIFFIDLEHQIIPNRFVLILLGIGILACFFEKEVVFTDRIIGFCVSAALFIGIYYLGLLLFKREAFGGGDVKLFAASGLLLGWQNQLVAVLICSVLGSIILIILRKVRNDEKQTEYPFGPFIAVGILVAVFVGKYIVDAYIGLLLA